MNNFEQQVEDLIRDTSFIMYCQKKDDREIAVWEARLLTQPELVPVVEEAKTRVRMIARGVIEAEMESGLARLKSTVALLNEEEAAIVHPDTFAWEKTSWRSVAAVIIVASLVFVSSRYRDKLPWANASANAARMITVPAGQHKTMRLPDGSLVILNGGSNLELSETFNKNGRELTLTGEAYFDVKQDAAQPFIIHTRTMDVKVLGTAFNVRSYPDETSDATSLIRGKVEISLLDAQKKMTGRYILKPMQKLVVETTRPANGSSGVTVLANGSPAIHLDSLVKNKIVNDYTETAWTSHNLVFDDETLEQAALKMEKWYGIEVVFEKPSLRSLKYTGTFEDDDLSKVLEIMKLTMPVLKYRIEKNKVVLY